MPSILSNHPNAVKERLTTGPHRVVFNDKLIGKINARHRGPPSLEKKSCLTSSLRLFLWLCLAVPLSVFLVIPVLADTDHPHVVILSSYHQGYDWSDKELAGVLDRLRQDYPTMDPPIEYLDAKRFPGQKQQERVKHYLIGKYRGRKVDLVIVLDNPALNLALGARQELFSGVPLVFAGINNFTPAMLQGQKKVTGVAEVEDIAGTLKLALKLQPGTREVLVIHDYTATGLVLHREMESALSAFRKQVQVSHTPPATFQEILAQLKALPAGAIGVITGFATDSQGVTLGLAESTRMLAAAPVPLYAMHETRLGHGIVGGVLLGGHEHGWQAGEMALRVLAGEDPSRIPVLTKSTAKPMVDYHQLTRFAISLDALPPGVLVINRPVSFYQRHKRWILATSMTVVFLSLVIFILSTNIVRRRLAEKALQASETRLRSVIDCTGEAIITVDRNRIITSINPAFTRMLGYTAAEVLGQSAGLIHPSEEEFQKFGEMVYPVIAATGSWRGEYELKKKDGTMTSTEMSLTPQRLTDGTLMGYIGALRDISEQKRVEEALRQSEENYRLVFKNAPLGIMYYDREGTITELNDAFAGIIGAPREKIIGFNMPRQLRNERMRQAVAASLAGQTGYYEGEYLSVTGGKGTQVRAFFRGVSSEKGKFLGGVSIFEDYTDKFRAEQKQKEYLNFIQSLMDAIPNPIFYKDLKGQYLGCNKACEEAWGKSREELIGKTVFDQHPRDLAEIYAARDEELFQNPGVQVYETSVAHADGSRKDVILHKAPFFNLDGTVGGIIGVEVDITARKWAEEALRQSEERFRLLVENAPDAILIQTGGRFAYVNKEALRLFGAFKEDQLVKQPVISRVPPSSQEIVKERMSRLNEAREAVPLMEQQYLKMDGTTFDAEVSAVPFSYQGQNGALIFVRDITERKKAEAALREGWRLNQTLMDSLPCVAMLLRPHTREIVAANEAAAQVGAVPGAFCYATFGRRQDPCPFCLAPATWETGQAQHLEVEALGVFWDAHWVPIQEDLYLHYAFDITARKEAETSQKILEAQLFQAQKMEALGTLAGGIAHDFNNVLGAMMGFTELACIELPESMAARTYLDNVLKAGDRARHLVKQILSFSRQEKVVQHPIAIPPIIKETLKFLRASLPTTIKIRTRLQAGEALVVADPTQIHQTLLNLCTNAAHAMEEKGGTLEIGLRELKISAQEKSLGYGSYGNLPPGSYLELLVSDTGHGMEPAVMERIFDPFFTTKEPWKGTGMGLAVVYGIVKSLKGEIQVSSQVGRGATFRVLLPLAEHGLAEVAPEAIKPLSKGRGCILFVDDDKDFFPAGQRMLAELGYEVVSYSSSLKALKDFASRPHRFDLIISDLTMPGLTGLELAAACLNLRPDIPFILATGFSETVSPEKVQTTGIREVVAKPFNLRQIGEIIEKVFKEEPERSRIQLEMEGR